jgi:hypothetical protein
MIDLSLAGLIGAIVGTAVAALAYGRLAAIVERAYRPRGASPTGAEHARFDQERSMLRRAVLALDILLFAGIGYWLGAKLWG